jgi:formate-dependent nitrite reductase membrane component NrfD
MRELVVTRHNPMIDPSLNVWGWEVPVYLFLGGLVAGMMIISGFFITRGRHRQEECSCTILPPLSIALLSIGILALFFDLEHKLYAWRMYVTFKPASPMSWGSWILIFVYVVLLATMVIRPKPWLSRRLPALNRWSMTLAGAEHWIRMIGFANITVGIALGLYTGVLLGALGARPLWNSPLLGLLFLVSGLSTAAAFVHLIATNAEERELLARADNHFLSIELLVLSLFLIGLVSSTRVQIASAQLLLNGAFAPAFWVFVVGLGIIIPLIIQSLAVRHRIPHTPVAPLCVIAGGLILRFVLVAAGQASHWTRTPGVH